MYVGSATGSDVWYHCLTTADSVNGRCTGILISGFDNASNDFSPSGNTNRREKLLSDAYCDLNIRGSSGNSLKRLLDTLNDNNPCSDQ